MSTLFSQLGRKAVTVCVAVTLILSLAGYATPPRAQAQYSVVDIPHTIQTILNGVQAAISAAADSLMAEILASLEIKEYVLDEIAFTLAKMALQEIVKSTVEWINSGFEGGPAFVTDLEQYLENTADEIAGEIIYGSDLGFLCSPLELDIRAALELQYIKNKRLSREVQCTLSGVVGNVDGFLNGNFIDGGWPGWFELVLEPQNNAIGAAAIAQARLTNDVLEAQGRDLNILEWGQGFLSWEECTEVGPRKVKKCTIVTPGDVIAEQLSFDLTVGERVLIEADEINEIISALFAQLGSAALQGAGGLLGLSEGGSNGSPSYLDQIGDPDYDTWTPGGSDGASSVVGFISASIAAEREYRTYQQLIVNRALTVMAEAQECDPTAADAAKTIRDAAQTRMVASLSVENMLVSLQAQFDDATPEEQLDLVDEYQALKATGVLHSKVGNVQEKYNANEEVKRLDTIAAGIDECPDPEEEDEDENDNGGVGGGGGQGGRD